LENTELIYVAISKWLEEDFRFTDVVWSTISSNADFIPKKEIWTKTVSWEPASSVDVAAHAFSKMVTDSWGNISGQYTAVNTCCVLC
jgi:hypothetical protein